VSQGTAPRRADAVSMKETSLARRARMPHSSRFTHGRSRTGARHAG
jgi:hypothetical protein